LFSGTCCSKLFASAKALLRIAAIVVHFLLIAVVDFQIVFVCFVDWINAWAMWSGGLE
jgi:hypothetical protein